ncbi:cell division protein DivIVA [Enterococcus villorum]|uniref:Cell cycle protein GpsB n=2 Tax=Enterococcus villorum TaxID=112904 RepID=A0A1V8YUN0_9ENTE|nr:cell division regulator GpsB [Enterococcus villorum]EOH89859.1 DivIVA domain-containing protein [Enterococcus villorum ATCC 700913]EOW78091.1 cell division protein DivIVA [Enterococcus villorum ATCC 700913]OQO71366.1 cell division protein DivIVA [Enterococcus villorum]OQO76311.1 cell division protein DivIVA [Enterococcus villorum]GEL90806.1 cell cycle protein GpsB [Enterococcus villorum]
MASLVYSPKDILQQEFKTKMRGYDPIEVDEFLDNIIKDYETYNKEILALQEENDKLSAKLAQLSKTQGATQTRTQQVEAPKSAAVTNFDILKRLSNLEREVFGKKLDQQSSTVKVSQPNPNNYTNTSDDDDNESTRQF